MVKAGVGERLKDPYSAKFGRIVVGTETKGVTSICGLVNAKNSFGAYEGMTPFFGTFLKVQQQPRFIAMGVGGSAAEIRAIQRACRENGAPL